MALSGSGLDGKEWKLTEVRINGENTGFDRNDLARIGLSEGFTLNFNAESVYGIGAPNNFGAPYTLRTDNKISVLLMVATEMAPLRELDKLKEYDYFFYLQNADSWELDNNNLLMNSKDADGKTAVLIFNPVYPER
jgi:heat shock protein HslJ